MNTWVAFARKVGRNFTSSVTGAMTAVLLAALLQASAALAQPLGPTVLPEFTIAADVSPAGSDTTMPGRAAIGFDGTNYLVVSCRTLGSPLGIFGVFVSPTGIVLGTVPIAPHICPANVSIAFDGSTYLVIFDGGVNGQITGVRVTPAGAVLDGPAGFPISTGIPFMVSNSLPDVAFDGVNYLVVWNKFIDSSQDIYGARVSSTGQVLGEFPIYAAPLEQAFAAVAFDGVNYLVVWQDQRSFPGDPDILGTRVTPGGVVLDPAGLAISTAPGLQGSPDVVFDGTNYFIVWADGREGVFARFDTFGTRMSPDGTLLDGPASSGGIPINTAAVSAFTKGAPRVGFDGTRYLVTWPLEAFSPPAGIFAARVSTAGELLDGPPSGAGIVVSVPTCSACRLVGPNVFSDGHNFLLTWANNTEAFGERKDILGALVLSAATMPLFLHGSGGTANPPVLSLDAGPPSSATAKYKDSAALTKAGGNPWKAVGTWDAAPSLLNGTLASLGDLTVWLGLKNSDDQGTNFDLRVEVLKKGAAPEPVTVGEAQCISGITRSPAKAKEVGVPLEPFAPVTFDGCQDVLSLTVLSRIGTGSGCGGHSNATGLRLYFDGVNQSSSVPVVVDLSE